MTHKMVQFNVGNKIGLFSNYLDAKSSLDQLISAYVWFFQMLGSYWLHN